jgi:membrane-bound lytic murein transglycosylase F
MRKSLFYFLAAFLLILFLNSCSKDKTGGPKSLAGSTAHFKSTPFDPSSKNLTILVDNSLTSYFVYKGVPAGFEYEMLSMYAQDNKMNVSVKIIHDVEHILDSLNAGKGHIAAANLTITKSRAQSVHFTKPLFRTRQILVQRLPDGFEKMTADNIKKGLITDRLDLEGKTVTVRPGTSYIQNLRSFIEETNCQVTIAESPSDMITERLISMVSSGEIDYTISDENKSRIHSVHFGNIDISTPMSLSEPIAWAVNKNDTVLLHSLNQWISDNKGGLRYNIVKNRFFEMDRRKSRIIKKEYPIVKKGEISPYDDLILKYARSIDWPGLLMIAQVYQESQFNPKVRSWQKAVGLMQVLPSTAKSYGVSGSQLTNPELNLKVGSAHLKMLRDHWRNFITDSLEVIKFTLSSYNAGLGHVQDAQRLCEKHGLDPLKFEDNLSTMLLNKSIPKYYSDPVVKYGYCRGREPVNYVADILRYYQFYREFKQ